MSQQGQRIPWRWDPDSKKYYYYDSRNDELVFEDGLRTKRPETIPRSAFNSLASTTQAGASDHRPEPVTQSQQYTYQQQLRPTPQASASGSGSGPRAGPSSIAGVASTTRDFANLNLQPTQVQSTGRPASEPSSSGVTTTRGQGYVDATNNKTGVRTVLQKGPPERITDQRLITAGLFAESALLGTDGDVERLYESYRTRPAPRRFFVTGRVFFILWAEPAGESSTQATGVESGRHPGRYGESVFSKVRRFVVILEGPDYCTCLPIASYGGQGVGKRGVTKSEHSIVHTTRQAPRPLASERAQRGEEEMQPVPIRIDADDPTDKLSELSRLDYGKFHTVHHNLKVRNFGKVNPNSMDAFQQQWNNVLQRRAASGARVQPPPTILQTIQEHYPPRRRRESDATRPAPRQTVQKRATAYRSQTERRPNITRQERRDSGSSDSGDGSGESESVASTDVPAQREPSSSDPPLQPSVRTVAIERIMARGYTRAQATQAVDNQARQRRDSAHRDDEDGSQSEDSREGPPRTQRSGRSHGSSDHARNVVGRQQAGGSRTTDTTSSGSRPRTQSTAQQSSSSQSRAAATTSAPTTNTVTLTTSELSAVQTLIGRGHPRSQAIAYLLQQRASRGGTR